MTARTRLATILVCALLAAPAVIAASGEGSAEASAACPGGLETMQGVGLVCLRTDGLYEVFDAQLRSLGTIHGNDPVPAAEDGFVAASGTTPACVDGALGTYYVQVIYARATNDVNNYTGIAPLVRNLVGNANNLVDQAGIATGSPASLKVKCVAGVVEVKNEVLPTAMGSASFSTIVTDLRAKGYNDPKVKYWVYYDDQGACGCAGQGHVNSDSSPGVNNSHNGNSYAMYAINYGYNSTQVWLHELGHNLGAVQNDAPYTTGGFHCIDGRDIMCYNDSPSPHGANYSTAYCATTVFDCNKNTYFHASPPAGSYLATRWNLGSPVNRYLQLGTPALTLLTCTTNVPLGNATTCTFSAADDSAGVLYTIQWGDGTTATVPASGYVAPGVNQTATRTFASAGTRVVNVTATDSDGRVGNTLSFSASVRLDAPVVTQLVCPASIELNATATCSMRASDNSSGVRFDVSWGDATTTSVPASGFVAPSTLQNATHAWTSAGAKTVSVIATDSAGVVSNPRNATVNVYVDAPNVTLLSCASPVERGAPTTCAMRAADNSSGVRFLVDWGDGTTTTVPAAGFVAPGTTQNATRTYAAAGSYAVKVRAIDNLGTTGPQRNATAVVAEDLTPPTLSVQDPRPNITYVGCSLERPTPVALGRATWVETACVRATAADARSGVDRIEVLVGGVVRATDSTAPYQLEFPVPSTGIGVSVIVRAIDEAGNAASVAMQVDMVAA